ncbi:TIGR00730 family Rossman fold protein [Limnohabitans sp. Hippo4]|uniref:LOG family protein n=1 Tax=Limnohabitans sp. Hippo4 TaxID=1826167 RepID=UPI000D36B79C|nr:TIGR00730 family Rossman fold protein [Limnohabitans sp. Hippo4]PUE36849.1 Rossman fold protein, TIGR00730 family [Limnohabitans sp. Hippo4]
MQSTQDLNESKEVADAYRLAFNDPEFLRRPETRGIRFQLELLKPELIQTEEGIHNTVVVFGSARFKSLEEAQRRYQEVSQLPSSAQNTEVLALAQRDLENASYYEAARKFAHLVSQACASHPKKDRLTICTGGGPGIMEAANRGAMEAGAPSVAMNISLPHEQAPNPYVTPGLSFQFHYFALRKMHFAMRAKALISFPGGFGTLDELFEILTLVQTRKVQATPVLLYGSDFWKRLIDFDWLVSSGTIAKEDLACFKYVDSPEEACEEIKKLLPC